MFNATKRGREMLQPIALKTVCFHLICVCAITCMLISTVDAQDDFVSPVNEDGHVIDFARDIAPIFKKHCLECHGPKDAKNDFRVDDPDSMSSYVEAGDVELSSLYVDFLAIDDEDSIMPPKKQGGPLSPGELALIRVWIEEGAVWPDGVKLTDEVVPPPPPAPQSLFGRVWGFQGFLHPATVHFPVALLLFGAAFVVLGWKWPVVGTQIPLACLVFGALTAIGATMMGWSFAAERGYSDWTNFDMNDEFFWHRWGGVIVTSTATIFALVAIKAVRSQSEKLTKIWKIGLLVCAGMVGAVGHQGGELTYGHDFYPRAFRVLLGTPEEVAAEPEAEAVQPETNDQKSAAVTFPAESLIVDHMPDTELKKRN